MRQHVLLCALLLVSSLVQEVYVHAQSATCAPTTALSGPSGAIRSDDDGSGPLTVDATPRTCTWVIQCTAGQQVRITAIAGELTVDQYSRVLDELWVGDVRMTGPIGTSQRPPTTFRSDRVEVRFIVPVVSGSLYRRSTKGWTVEYECVAASLTAGHLPWTGCPESEQLLALTNDTVVTDLDGFGVSPHDTDRDCLWRIRCGAGERIAIDLAKATSTTMNLTRGDGGLWLAVSDAQSSFVLPMNEVGVRLPEGRSSNGMTLAYRCAAPADGLSAGCPAAQPVTMSDPRGTIMSDPDGSGPLTVDATPRTCTWEVVCPRRMWPAFYSVAGELTVDQYSRVLDELWVGDVRTTGVVEALPHDLVARLDMLTGGVGGAVVRFAVPVVSGSLYRRRTTGWTLRYQCVHPPRDHIVPYVGCPSSFVTLRALNDTALTDVDGSGPYQHSSDWACQWKVQCPTHMHMSVGWSTTRTTLSVSSPSGNATLSGVGSDIAIDASSAFVVVSAGNVAGGATFKYRCRAQNESRAQSFQCSSAPVVLDAPQGSILSDVDGAGAGAAYTHADAPLTCAWSVTCPLARDGTPAAVRFSSVDGGLATDQYSRPMDVLSVDGTDYSALDAASVSAITGLAPGAGAAIPVVFTINPPSSRSVYRRGNSGFALHYRCVSLPSATLVDNEVTCEAAVHCSGNGNLTAPGTKQSTGCPCRCQVGWAGQRCDVCAFNYSEYPLPCGQLKPEAMVAATQSATLLPPVAPLSTTVTIPVPSDVTATRSIVPDRPTTVTAAVPVEEPTATVPPADGPPPTATRSLPPQAKQSATRVVDIAPPAPTRTVSLSPLLRREVSVTETARARQARTPTLTWTTVQPTSPPATTPLTTPPPPSGPHVTLSMSVVPPPQVEEPPTFPIADSPATQTVTVAAAAAGSAFGGGGAADLQALGVATLITCADPHLKAAASAARRSLLPFSVGQGEAKHINALLSIVGGVYLVQFVASLAAFGFLKFKGDASYIGACEMVRCPTWALAVTDACAQGLALESVRLLARNLDDGPMPIIMGTLGLAVMLVHMSIALHIVRRVVPVAAVFVEYERAHYAAPAFLQPLVAQGRWGPTGLRHRFGAFFNAWRPEGLWMTIVAVARPLFVGVLANLDAPSQAWCVAQFVVLGFVSVLTGLAVLVFRPYRAPGRTLAAALSAMATGVVLGSPAVPGTSSIVGWLVLGATFLSIIVAIVTAGFNTFETQWMKQREPSVTELLGEASSGKRALLLPVVANDAATKADDDGENEASRSASDDENDVASTVYSTGGPRMHRNPLARA